MERFNIVKPKKYKKGEEEKTNWANCGTLIKLDDGKMFMELNWLEGTFQVFKQEPKQAKPQRDPVDSIPF